MAIYLVQHGKCLPEDLDPDRHLTEEGERETRAVAELLAKSGLRIERVYHSGKTRARQTAAILASVLSISAEPRAIDGMRPNDDVAAFSRGLDFGETFYVGHLPFMERLVSYLVVGSIDRRVIEFRNSGVACLERDAAEGMVSLAWYVVPGLA